MSTQPNISIEKSTETQSGDDQRKFMRKQAYSLQTQLNQRQQFQTITTTIPNRSRYGDTAVRVTGTGISMTIRDSKGGIRNVVLGTDLNNYAGYLSGIIPPTSSTFPSEGAWGWYKDTATSYVYLARNIGGSLANININTLDGNLPLSDLTGTISDTQHGNRSVTATTMHSFPQISGQFAAGQHPNIAGSATANDYHALATTTTHGFMTFNHFIKITDATPVATANKMTEYDSAGNLSSATVLYIATVQVLGARNTGWTAMTNTADKATAYDTTTITLPQLAARVKSIQDALTTHGILGA